MNRSATLSLAALALTLTVDSPSTLGVEATAAASPKEAPAVVAPKKSAKKKPSKKSTPAAKTDDEPFKRRIAGIFTPGLGIYNMFKEPRSLNVRLEYRTPFKLWALQPFLGMTYNSDIDFYGYVGLGLEFFITDRIYFMISGAIGYYRAGKGLDLGYPLEFREGLEVGYRFDNKYRVSITIYHMSNSTLGEFNPGQESLSFSFGFPLYVDSSLDREPITMPKRFQAMKTDPRPEALEKMERIEEPALKRARLRRILQSEQVGPIL